MRSLYYFFLPILLLLNSAWTYAEDVCDGNVKHVPFRKVLASAGMWDNSFNRKGSISYESNEIFVQAKQEAVNLTAEQNFCSKGCVVKDRPEFHFISTPHKMLTDYDDHSHCRMLFDKTSKNPLQYKKMDIKSVDDLNEWISDLSQGDGDQGEDLYEKCDKSCSPQFSYTISKNNDSESYSAYASVICGDARDKDDNHYDLQSYFQWSCRSEGK